MIKVFRGKELLKPDIDGIFKLSKIVYEAEYVVPVHILKSWFEINPDIFIIVKDTSADNQIVGYLISIPLNKKAYALTFNADFDEKKISPEDIQKCDKGNGIYLHLCSIAIHPSYLSKTQVYKKLLTGIADLLYDLQLRNIFFNEASAYTVSQGGERVCSFLKMRCIKVFNDNEKVYSCPTVPRIFCSLSKVGKKVFEGYQKRNSRIVTV